MKQEIVTSVKLNSKQFAIFEMNGFQTSVYQFNHRKITIDKLTIDKGIVGEITVREVAIFKNATFKFPIVDFLIGIIDFFKSLMYVN
jgi:hypothetical protein